MPIVVAAVLITLPLGYVALNNSGSFELNSTMPESEAKEGVEAITENAYGGLVMPTYVLLEIQEDDPLFTYDDTSYMPSFTWTDEGKVYAKQSVKLMLEVWNSDGSLKDMLTGNGDGNIAYVLGMVDCRVLRTDISTITGIPEEDVLSALADH